MDVKIQLATMGKTGSREGGEITLHDFFHRFFVVGFSPPGTSFTNSGLLAKIFRSNLQRNDVLVCFAATADLLGC